MKKAVLAFSEISLLYRVVIANPKQDIAKETLWIDMTMKKLWCFFGSFPTIDLVRFRFRAKIWLKAV